VVTSEQEGFGLIFVVEKKKHYEKTKSSCCSYSFSGTHFLREKVG
jgi:hypothetical protein